MALFMSNVEKKRVPVVAALQDAKKDAAAKKSAMAAAAAAAAAAAEAAAPRMASQKQLSLKGQIVIYSIQGCPHCAKAKATLREQRLPFLDVSVDRFPANVGDWLRERTGKTSVPQIFFNDRLVGTNEDLQKLVADEDRFKDMLDYVRETEMPTDPETAPLLPHPEDALDLLPGMLDGDNLRCEPDEYAALVDELRKDGVVGAHRWRGGRAGAGALGAVLPCLGRVVKDSFTGKDLVDWCVDKKMMTRERGVFMGKQLVSRRFGVNVASETEFRDDINALYKLATSDDSRALNASQISECVQRPAGEIADDMRKLTLKLFSDFLSPDGKYVDYKGIGTSKSFETYKRMTMELQRVNLERLSREEKLAFFINIYNALVIHGTVEKGVPANMWQRYKFFSTIAYNLGGRVYSLNDIENGVLRSNRASMGTLYIRPFGESDPRYKVILPECEPRIHFALNCGAKSCPPIKTFSAQDIDKELDLATEAYLEGDDALRIELAEWEDEEEEEKRKKKKRRKGEQNGEAGAEEQEEGGAKEGGGEEGKENGGVEIKKKEVRIEDIETVKEEEVVEKKEEKEEEQLENGEAKKEDGEEEGEEGGGGGGGEGGERKKANKKSKEKEDYFPPRPTSTVHLSMLFKWYKPDFGDSKEEVLRWIHERLGERSEKRAQLEEILRRAEEARGEEEEGGGSGQPVFKVRHIKYDWGHNDKDKKEKEDKKGP